MVEFFNLGEADVHLRAGLHAALLQKLGQAVQGLRPEHDVHVRRALDDLRAFLAGDAAAHANLHAALLEVAHPAQVGKYLFLCLFTHRTGVEENQVGFFDVLRGLVAFRSVHDVQHLG